MTMRTNDLEPAGSNEEVQETIREKLKADIRVWARIWGRPIGLSLFVRLFFFEPGYQLSLALRFQEAVGRIPLFGALARRIVWRMNFAAFACDIDPQASFGGGLYLPHPLGIVIGGGSRIGRDVCILQGVTIGRGSGSSSNPVVEDRVSLNAGAIVYGGVTIGRGAVVGGNAVVGRDLAPGATYVGASGRVIER